MRTKTVNLILDPNINSYKEELDESQLDDDILITEERTQDCCSRFRYNYIGNCCCKWLSDNSNFWFKISNGFLKGKNEIWTCNDCDYGFECSYF